MRLRTTIAYLKWFDFIIENICSLFYNGFKLEKSKYLKNYKENEDSIIW